MRETIQSIIEFLESRASNVTLSSSQKNDFVIELKSKINQLSAVVPNTSHDAVTILYSGIMPDGKKTGAMAQALVDASMPSKILTLAQTEVAALLDLENARFHSALKNALGPDGPERAVIYKHLLDGTDLSGNRVASDSLWDDAARRFAANAEGEVRVIAPKGLANGVFAQTELPTLLENPKVTSIDGIPRSQLNAMKKEYDLEAVKRFVFDHSLVQTHMSGLVGGDIGGYLDLDPGSSATKYGELLKDGYRFSAFDKMLGELDPERFEQVKTSLRQAFDVGEDLASKGLSKVANKLGPVGLMMGALLATNSAAAAEAAGDHDRAKEIMVQWGLDAAGSAAGEAIGAAIGGIAIAALAAAGVAVSAPLAGAAVLGAALVGGIFGAEAVTGIYDLTKGLDESEKRELLDNLTETLFGSDYTLTTPLPPDLDGKGLTLLTSTIGNELFALAKSDIAWRYALKQPSLFGITDIDYSEYNINGELDRYNPATGQGSMTDPYLFDRAQFLALLHTWKVTDNQSSLTGPERAEYHDLELGELLYVSPESPNTNPSRLFVFGTEQGEELPRGLANSDHLYGGGGDDVLDGAGGGDRLEGGTGHDIYKVTAGDTILDRDGDGEIDWNGTILTGGQRISPADAPAGATIRYSSADGLFTYDYDQTGKRLLIYRQGEKAPVIIEGYQAVAETEAEAGAEAMAGAADEAGPGVGALGLTLNNDPQQPPTGNEFHGDDNPDTVIVGSGNQYRNVFTYDGEDEITILSSEYPGVWVQAGEGDDFVWSDILNVDLYYNGEEVTLVPGQGATLSGEGGNDFIEGGLRDDLISGGGDHDSLFGLYGSDVVSGGTGNDALDGNEGLDLISGGTGDDYLFGGTDADHLSGDDDSDVLYGDASGPGITWDGVQFSGYPMPAFGGTYALVKEDAEGSSDVLEGGAGDDRLYGGMGDDWLYGGADNDQLEGEGGEDILDGGAGDDWLFGDKSEQAWQDDNAVLASGNGWSDGAPWTLQWRSHEDGPEVAGNDQLSGGAGNDHLFGLGGNDTLDGGADDDQLAGGEGDDRLVGDTGNDLLDGGAGEDTLSGGAGVDQLEGGDDNDYLYGGGEDDTLYGQVGDDVLDGGTGGDTLWGGEGLDELSGGEGADFLYGEADGDILQGGAGADQLVGEGGDDTLEGGSDGDALFGGEGSDSLSGGQGADYLEGNAGNDTLEGGSGNDRLVGGEGNDTYLIGSGWGVDIIEDSGANTLVFGDSIAPGGLKLMRDHDDLVVSEGDNHLKIQGWFGAAAATAGFRFGDGTVLEAAAVEALVTEQLLGDGTLATGADTDTLFRISSEVGDGFGITISDAGGHDRVVFERLLLDTPPQFGPQYITPVLEGMRREGDDLLLDVFMQSDVVRPDVRGSVRLAGYYTAAGGFESLEFPDGVLGGNNNAPVLANPLADQLFEKEAPFSFQVPEGAFSDDAIDILSYGATLEDGSALPGWLAFDAATRTFSGTPAAGDEGIFQVTVTATDLGGLSVSDSFSLSLGVNVAPEVSSPIDDQNASAGSQFSFQVRADAFSDPNPGDSLSYAATRADGSPLPPWLSFDPATRMFTGTPTLDDRGTLEIAVQATDQDGLLVNDVFNIEVELPRGWYIGTESDDYLQGSGGDETFFAGAGNDRVDGNAGNDTIHGEAGTDSLNGGRDDDLLYGDEGDDYLRGNEGNDRLIGGAGADYLNGYSGNDVLEGGPGDDYLKDSQGNDAYFFELGSGSDVIDDPVGTNTLHFGPDIEPGQLTVTYGNGPNQSESVLFLSIGYGDGDRVEMELGEFDDSYQIVWHDSVATTSYQFAGGEVLTHAQILEYLNSNATEGSGVFLGTPGRDEYYAGDGNDNLYGQGGSDTLYGEGGNDLITGATEEGVFFYGGAGDDYLRGGDGDDVLDGGSGRDRIFGSGGNDILRTGSGNDWVQGGKGDDLIEDGGGDTEYEYEQGDGHDTIVETGGHDELNFDNFDDLVGYQTLQVSRVGDDLVLTLEANSSVTIKSWFASAEHRIERFYFENFDGVLTADDIQALIPGQPPANHSPELANPLADQSTDEDAPLSLQIAADTFQDPDADDSLTYSASLGDGSPLPDWLDFDPLTRTLSGTPGNAEVGALEIEMTATDSGGESASDRFTLDVRNTNDAPVLSLPLQDRVVEAGAALSFQLPTGSFTDPDVGDSLAFSATLSDGSPLPGWLAFDPATRTLSGTPADENIGEIGIRITAGDSGGLSVADDFVLNVGLPEGAVVGTDGDDTLQGGGGDDRLLGLGGDDLLTGKGGIDHLSGGDGADLLKGGKGTDRLYGEAGDDELKGGNGDDFLEGGAGNDRLTGEKGRDSYRFEPGFGQDTLLLFNSDDAAAGITDRVEFAVGIGAGEFTLSRSGNDLLMVLAGGSDMLTVKNWFKSPEHRFDNFVFEDGSSLPPAGEIFATLSVLTGSEGDDTLVAYSGDETLYGLGGDDTLKGMAGADVLQGGAGADLLKGGNGADRLYGEAGDDELKGGNGDDLLEGGAGNDRLTGGMGWDTYRFEPGFGQDTLLFFDSGDAAAGISDRVEFGAGISAQDFEIGRSGNDLLLTRAGGDDVLTVKSWFASPEHRFDNFVFADGGSLPPAEDIFSTLSVLTGSDGDDTLVAYPGDETLHGLGGDDTLKGKAGDDVLFGGEGADRLRGGDGDDTLAGGAGDDILRGDRGSDTYLFGRNDGVDTVKDYNGKDADPATYGETSDRVLMGEGIAADQLWFSQHGDDLDIGIIGSDDRLRIDDWYLGGDYRVDQFELPDGSRLMAAQVQQLVEAMAAFSPPQSGELDLPPELRQPLEPVIAASWQPAGSV